MKCVILAAGRGERMMPLTANTPKPLLKVRGVPLIDHVLQSLPDEIDEVIIVVKYLGDQIKKHVGKYYEGMKITYVTGSDEGNVYSFLNAGKYLEDERFLLIYGDEIPDPHAVRDCMGKNLSVLCFLRDGKWVPNGVMVLNTEIFDHDPVDESFASLFEQFASDHTVYEFRSIDFLGDINTPEDLERAERTYGQS